MSGVLTGSGQDQRTRLRHTEEILKSLTLTMRSRTLYPEGHPLLTTSSQKVIAQMREHLEHDDAWTIVLLGGEFVYDRVPLSRLMPHVQPLYKTLAGRQIDSLTVRKGVTPAEIVAFFGLVLAPHDLWDKGGDPTTALAGVGIKNLIIQRVDIAKGGAIVSTDTDEARDIYVSLKQALKAFGLSLVDPRRTPSLDLVNQLRDRLVAAMQGDPFAVASRLHTRHAPDDLFAHSINTAIIAYLASRAMGVSPTLLPDVVTAGLLHDIGLMDIPPKIRDGAVLVSDDSRIYVEHPIRGLGILRSIPGVPLLAEIAVFEHHRQWNGEGFPHLADKRAMSTAAAIISMANAYDHLMHGAVYTPPEQIPLRMIKMAGSDFEPRMLAHFLVALGMYPPGTYVQLTTEETALVVDASRGDVFRPTVKVLRDRDGNDVLEDRQLDLTERDPDTGGYHASIVRSVPPL